MQADCLVEFLAGLHLADHSLHTPIAGDDGVELLLRSVGDPQGTNSVMLASSGVAGIRSAKARNISAVLSASRKIASAPASM